ncbi:MAG: hypothetical protein GEV10_15540 [Streptosporangiales bacterium]|nr:hypothetical protein [Streptosporangiales bacterium]
MTTKVSWHRMAIGQLRFPPVCVTTGQPAVQGTKIWFQNAVARWAPRGIVSLILAVQNRPVMLELPVSAETGAKVRNARIFVLVGVLGGLALAFGGAILANRLLGGTIGGIVFVLGILCAVGSGVFGQIAMDVFGTNVDRDWLSMSKAHPAFVHALLQLNPPGMVLVDGVAPGAPQQQGGYAQQLPPGPQQAPPYQQPQYQQPQYQQPQYQQPQYQQPQYQQPQYGQPPYPQAPQQYGQQPPR